MLEKLKSLKTQVHLLVEDHFLYRGRPGSKSLPVMDKRFSTLDAKALIDGLKSDGIAIFSNFVGSESLGEINRELKKTYNGERSDMVTSTSEEGLISYIKNPLKLSPQILKLALDPLLISLMENYFQSDVYLSDVDMRRILPISMENFEKLSPAQAKGYSSSHWHYDVRGRQVKIMIYLHDVNSDDQNFAFCPGTHLSHSAIKRSRLDRAKSRFPDGWPETNGFTVRECTGKAGSLMLFDTNAIHRLRRKNTRVRDTVTFYYTPGQELRSLEFKTSDLTDIPFSLHRILGGRRI